MITPVTVATLSYLLGSIPTALWLGRLLRGIDIREHGSGNPGATNAARVLGLPAGVAVLLIDVTKGFVAVWWVARLRIDATNLDALEIELLAAVGAIVGHIVSVFARFRGGKGVATAGGAFLAVHPAAAGIAVAAFAVVVAVTRIVSLGSLGAALTMPVALWALGAPRVSILATVGVALLIAVAHRSNIRRLLRGREEPGI